MLRTSIFSFSPALAMLLAPLLSGCGSRTDEAEVQPPPVRVDSFSEKQTEGILLLEEDSDRVLARQQGICPVSGEPLGSMGKPIKLTVEGREVFICCAGCEDTLREDPEKYFSILDRDLPQSQ